METIKSGDLVRKKDLETLITVTKPNYMKVRFWYLYSI